MRRSALIVIGWALGLYSGFSTARPERYVTVRVPPAWREVFPEASFVPARFRLDRPLGSMRDIPLALALIARTESGAPLVQSLLGRMRERRLRLAVIDDLVRERYRSLFASAMPPVALFQFGLALESEDEESAIFFDTEEEIGVLLYIAFHEAYHACDPILLARKRQLALLLRRWKRLWREAVEEASRRLGTASDRVAEIDFDPRKHAQMTELKRDFDAQEKLADSEGELGAQKASAKFLEELKLSVPAAASYFDCGRLVGH